MLTPVINTEGRLSQYNSWRHTSQSFSWYDKDKDLLITWFSITLLITSQVSGRGHRIGTVCEGVCVRILTAKSFDLRPRFPLWDLTLTLARLRLWVKVIGQRSRLSGRISFPYSKWWGDVWSLLSDMAYDGTTCDVIVWRHMMSHYTVKWCQITGFGAKGLANVQCARCVNAQALNMTSLIQDIYPTFLLTLWQTLS